MKDSDSNNNGNGIFGYAYTSLCSLSQAPGSLSTYINDTNIDEYRKCLSTVVAAASVIAVGASLSSTVVPAAIVKMATIHTISYTSQYLSYHILRTSAKKDKYWQYFGSALKAVSDNTMIIGGALFLTPNINAGLLAATGTHMSVAVNALSIVIARSLSFELNKIKGASFNQVENKGHIEFFQKNAMNFIGIRVINALLESDYLTSLAVFTTIRSFSDIMLDPKLTKENFLETLADNAYKPLAYALDFITMSIFDQKSAEFITSGSILSVIAKAGYFKSYQAIIENPIQKHVKPIIKNLAEITIAYCAESWADRTAQSTETDQSRNI